jgi:hypothetical protein
MRRAAAVVAAISLGTSCASELTFHDAPVVWRVNDDRTISEPEENERVRLSRYARLMVWEPADRALSLPDKQVAQDINALDEVPDSTWFENRIGRFDLTPDDVARGVGGPPPEPPFLVTKGKSEGSNAGFFIKDAKGRKYLLKLDLWPEMRTANGAIVSRLFWAMGYHVPSDNVVTFKLADLKIDAHATYDEGIHEDLPLGTKELEEVLKLSPPARLGEYRGLASQLLDGKPKGGFSPRGRRDDDPNDTIDHEHRRSLRGLQVFSTWLDHSDMGEHNTIDMYVEEGGRKFLKHHLMDFGETLGAHAITHDWVGYAYAFDYEYQLGSLFTFGLWKRPWEGGGGQPFRTVGRYFPDTPPELWREKKPYYPFYERTDADAFWAAKIVMRFTRKHVEAAVATGKLSDPAASRYLVDTIMARQRLIGLAYMTDITAFDRFDVSDRGLCMIDLSVLHGLATGGVAERVEDGDVIETSPVGKRGEVCLSGPGESSYARYRLQMRRDGDVLDPIEVHVRGGAKPRVIGVIRDFSGS